MGMGMGKEFIICVSLYQNKFIEMDNSILERITINDEICNGRPTIRGYRLTVQTILEFLFAGTPEDEILKQYPFLELADIEASKQFAILLMDNKYTLKGLAA